MSGAPTTLADVPAPTPTVMPQNSSPLTNQFTETERARVQLLVTTLPLIFEEAFKDLKDEAQCTASVDFWGVPIDPLKGDADPRVSVILVKFLRARNMNVDAAQEMFINTLRWRHTFRASETINEEFPKDVFGQTLFMFGKDKGGRPISYNIYSRTDNVAAIFSDLERFKRWRIGKMEEALRLLDFLTTDSITQVFDMEGLNASTRDAQAKRAATEMTKMMTDYYPETLHKKYFVNCPAMMAWIFWAARLVVPARTFAKLQMIGRGPETIGKEMLNTVDRSELPKQYGGDVEGF